MPKVLPTVEAPTYIFHPEQEPRIVPGAEVESYYSEGWYDSPAKAFEAKVEAETQRRVAEGKAAASNAEETAPVTDATEPAQDAPETPSEPVRDSSGAEFDPAVHVSETSLNKDGTFRKKPGKKAA